MTPAVHGYCAKAPRPRMAVSAYAGRRRLMRASEGIMLKRTTVLLAALVAAAVVVCAGLSARADEGEVDLLLVLAADVSRSVDDAQIQAAARRLCRGHRGPARGAGHDRRPQGPHRPGVRRMGERVGTEGRHRLDGHCRRARCRGGVRPRAARPSGPTGGAHRSARPSISAWRCWRAAPSRPTAASSTFPATAPTTAVATSLPRATRPLPRA